MTFRVAVGGFGAIGKVVAQRLDQGIEGLIDGRAVRERIPGARQDPRVLEMLLMLMSDDVRHGRAESAEGYRQSVSRMLDVLHGSGAVPLPSRSTFQRVWPVWASSAYSADGPSWSRTTNTLSW